MSETLSIAEFKKLRQTKPHLGRKKGNGDKAKAEMEMVLKLMGVDYKTEFIFHPTRKWRFDFAIPGKKIGIEFEGIMSKKSRHTTVTGYSKDSEKYNAAAIFGWTVLRYTVLTYKNLTKDLQTILKREEL